jgi:YidC/Oxa1 family membrane protein insertase
MDKNTITGLVLIGLLLIGFSYFSRPSEEQQAAMRHYNDSIAVVKEKEDDLKAKQAAALAVEEKEQAVTTDSASLFHQATQGEESFTTLENELVKISISNKGGRIYSAILKKYNDQQKQPLALFDKEEAALNFNFYNKEEIIQTARYYFEPVNVTDSSVVMRLYSTPESYIDFSYKLHPNSYLVDFNMQATGMKDQLAAANYVDIEWAVHARQQEKGFTYENRLACLMYKTNEETDDLSTAKDDEIKVDQSINWIGFKNQFFSSVFIADQSFKKSTLTSKLDSQESGYIKDYSAEMNTFFDPTGAAPTSMHFYFGPNHYKILQALDKGRDKKWELDDLVYLGWPIVRLVNKWFTINVFDWLSRLGLSMGIVLLLMTIIVKIVIFPATWKTYMSSAKMRVLKPKIEVINAKYPKQEDAMKKQQEVMGLYSQYGVSPMGGCLPMLLQFPIVIALFSFVPSAIELRQEGFLWASDLSTYDAFIHFPFRIPFMGSHLSLFCLLMTITTLVNTKYTLTQQDTGAQPQMAAMKWMMYIMPVMFLFILNDLPAGLNYYYFISTLIGVITMIVLKRTTNEEKLLALLEANKKEPKKSGFAARLESMQKQQEEMKKARLGKKK